LKRHPKYVTTEWAVEKRRGKIFLDYNQNVRGKTLASVYSPRPSPLATVSTPLRWDEIGKVYPTDFTIENVPDRLARLGDLWADILNSKRDLKKLLKLT
jgi:bifunctional non-homologous end joining protein LigD